MTDQATPQGLVSSAQLGPLPKQTHFPGWTNIPYYTADQMRAYAGAAAATERERWEKALKQSWQAIDPIRPAGQPGSYARGYDNGFAAALQVLRGNLKA